MANYTQNNPFSTLAKDTVLRSHYTTQLRSNLIGEQVTLAGWVARRRDHGGVAFLDVRDAAGLAQVVIREEADFDQLRNEFVIAVTGTVQARPEGNENPQLDSGDVELIADTVSVLNTSAALPFQIDDHIDIGEEARLKHRYLDLRRSAPRNNLTLRSEVNRVAREYLHTSGYTEIETPTLTRSTPEGARDFLVPARLAPGAWYALPQSPQLFKQLLQVGGFEKYYQIARCYRDEDFRADRQPEFTQLDIEASFVDQEDVISLTEGLIKQLWKLIDVDITAPLPRITYHEAMRRFGTDKPDTRFGVELVELTEFFSETTFRVFQSPYVGAVVMPGGASQARRTLDGWQEWAKQRGAKGLAYVLIGEDGELGGPVAKNLNDKERAGLAAAVGAAPGDCVFFAAGEASPSRSLLGAARNEIASRTGLIDTNTWSLLWVVDAPMFEPTAAAQAAGDVAVGAGSWTAVHHAFTAPRPEYAETFDTDPESALAYAYDIVCNGNEIGGGSIRVHQRDVQERIFTVMGIEPDQAAEKFGFLLEAMSYGAPPHGGIALGWDRLVAFLAGEESIREVIAFPKTGNGYDPLTAAPAAITAQQRKEAGVDASQDRSGQQKGSSAAAAPRQ